MAQFAADKTFPKPPPLPRGPGGVPVYGPDTGLPEAAGVTNPLGPRIIGTGVDTGPQTTGAIGGGQNLPTLEALMARQQELAGKQAPMGEMISPWQGIAYAADKLMSGLERGRVDRQEAEQRQQLAEILSSEHPDIGRLAVISPEIALHVFDQQNKEQKGTWEPIPTPQGENGQWARNTVTGELKKVGGGSPGEGGPKITDETALRQDYMSDPAYKNYSQAKPIWEALKEAAPRLTGPSALNVIIGMAKLFDPGSVVRTEEGEAVTRTGGPGDILAGWAEYIKGHGSLTPQQRDQLMQEGYGRMKGYYDALQHHRQWVAGIATRNGFKPENVVDDPGPLEPYKSPESVIKQPKAGPDGKLDFSDMTTEEIEAWTKAQGGGQ